MGACEREKKKKKLEQYIFVLRKSSARFCSLFILFYLCFTCSSVFVGLIGVFFFFWYMAHWCENFRVRLICPGSISEKGENGLALHCFFIYLFLFWILYFFGRVLLDFVEISLQHCLVYYR